jgi:hypothetical protein
MKLSRHFALIIAFALACPAPTSGGEATIDRMSIGRPGSEYTFESDTGFLVIPERHQFYRSDGIVWNSGAGGNLIGGFSIQSVVVEADELRYVLDPNSASILMQYTDFNAGNYSSTGTLVPAGPLVIRTSIGSSSAILDGTARISENDFGYAPPRGALYSAAIDSIISFRMNYELVNSTWSNDTFDAAFQYRTDGWIEFVPVPEPLSKTILFIAFFASLTAPFRRTKKCTGAVKAVTARFAR